MKSSSSCADCTAQNLPQCEPTGYISTHGAYFAPSPNIGIASATSTKHNHKHNHQDKEEDEDEDEEKDEPPPERAILLLTDHHYRHQHGGRLHARILADNLALRLDCDVWVPEYFQGPPLDVYPPPPPRTRTRARARPGLRRTLCEACVWAKAKAKLRLLPKIPMVMIKNRRTVVDARLSKFIKALQEEKDYVKIGAVGYCAGGSTAIRLASTEWIQSVVICHPGRFRLPELKAIKVPSAWVCADEDKFFTKSRRMKAEATFRRRKGTEKGIDYEFEEYRGTTHGFACRPDVTVKEMREAYEKAFEQIVRWFSKTLTV